ncbi:Na+/H+ antiporter [Flectobacillus longus]|uniref:Na+/H+ antiporter n=1 Tax=Flectobacillus longus TaxID=2984207 RepID=UPI0024B6BC81|nr:Na+/H+ antiporter [Flectobacillus longus]MDI9880320.1 Na+/H+ antiporter [Flectobacillus longus]
MENYTVILFVLGLIILLTALSERLNWSSPIFLIIAGLLLSLVPGFKPIPIDPEIIFLLFLPPLLYDAAFKIPQKDFWEHYSTISSLAFGLVFLTTVGIAVLSHYMIPNMNWPLSFLLGAILAATDAVAAIGITKNLGLSHRTTVILEGESLLNDASALVAYKFALASVAGAAFIWWQAGGTFLMLIAGGVLIGWSMALVLGFLLRAVKNNPTAVNSFLLLFPFVTYLLAEDFHVSGVIAVVVLGFIVSKKGKIYFSERIKKQSEHVWDMVIFLLNGLVFILIGLELEEVLPELDTQEMIVFSLYALAITLLAIVIRMLRIFLQRKKLKKGLQKSQKDNKRNISENMLINIQESLVISLSGMRGIVSLAIALALPETLENNSPFPMRAEILFITFMVILYSVVGQGMLLPIILKKDNSKGVQSTED